MKDSLSTVLISLAIALLAITIWGGCSSRPVVSDPAPDFTLASLDGHAVTLSDLEGQIVILDFWASWCSPCIDEMPHLQRLQEQYADHGVTVLAINVDETVDQVAGFWADSGYTFTVLFDTDSRVTDAYGVQGIPHTVIVDRRGEIYHVPIGLDDAEDALGRLIEK